MATTNSDLDDGQQKSILGSISRSVFTHYWMFTVYVLAYMTVGMALASVNHGWSWGTWGLAAATIWFGLEGLHAVDLAHEDIAINMDSRVQRIVGYVELAAGAVLGVALALHTTLWFLAFVGVGTFLGIAYNEEWFSGILHDHDTITGIANFGLSWAVIPFLGAYFVVAQTLSVGILLVALGAMLDSMRLIWLFEVSKPAPYDAVGIEHDREYDPEPMEFVGEVHMANTLNMLAWGAISIGLVVMFVV